jgi:phenylpropionate dioxygenase-like ring-hydroxylating dioxygenase large terminal subunit
LWVRLIAPVAKAALPIEFTQPPRFEPAAQAGWRSVVCGPYSVATSAPRLVENFLDMSHFGFVHCGSLGDAAHAQVDVGHVEETATGVLATNCRAWQPQGYAGAEGGQLVAYHYAVLGPYAATLQKESVVPDGPRNAIALFINPVQAEACTAWFVISTCNDPSTDESLRVFQDAVFAQDRPVVESQTPVRLPIYAGGSLDTDCASEVHGPADRLSAAYRRCLVRWGVTLGVC